MSARAPMPKILRDRSCNSASVRSRAGRDFPLGSKRRAGRSNVGHLLSGVSVHHGRERAEPELLWRLEEIQHMAKTRHGDVLGAVLDAAVQRLVDEARVEVGERCREHDQRLEIDGVFRCAAGARHPEHDPLAPCEIHTSLGERSHHTASPSSTPKVASTWRSIVAKPSDASCVSAHAAAARSSVADGCSAIRSV